MMAAPSRAVAFTVTWRRHLGFSQAEIKTEGLRVTFWSRNAEAAALLLLKGSGLGSESLFSFPLLEWLE